MPSKSYAEEWIVIRLLLRDSIDAIIPLHTTLLALFTDTEKQKGEGEQSKMERRITFCPLPLDRPAISAMEKDRTREGLKKKTAVEWF